MPGDVSRLLARILAGIRQGKVLSTVALRSDVRAILRKRERPAFEKHLVQRFDVIDARKKEVGKQELEYIEDFVEDVFTYVFENTESDDLSAYVSDDFGLLAEALHLGYEDTWLNGLAAEYSAGRVPCERIQELPGKLWDHVERLSVGHEA